MKTGRLIKRSLIFTFCLATLVACSDDDEPLNQQLLTDQGIIEDFLSTNNITAEKSDRGFYFRPLVTNESGEAVQNNDIVSVYYNLSILNGQVIHSVEAPDDPVQILFGGLLVIPAGLELALEEMRVGETYEFFIPSDLSYSNYSYQSLIPALGITRLEIEVVRIDDVESQKATEKDRILQYLEAQGLQGAEAKEDGLYYVQTEAGTGDPPNNRQLISVNYTGTLLDGFKFDSSFDRNEPFNFQVGAGQVIQGWDLGFKDLTVGEKGFLLIPSHLAYGPNIYITPPVIIEDLINQGSLRPFPSEIPPYATLVFEVEVVDFL